MASSVYECRTVYFITRRVLTSEIFECFDSQKTAEEVADFYAKYQPDLANVPGISVTLERRKTLVEIDSQGKMAIIYEKSIRPVQTSSSLKERADELHRLGDKIRQAIEENLRDQMFENVGDPLCMDLTKS